MSDPYFKIEKYVPPYDYSPETRRTFKSINLMVYLTEGLTYERLYTEDIHNFFPTLVERARVMSDFPCLCHGAYTDDYDIQPALYNGFLAIQSLLDQYPNRPVILRTMFTAKHATKTLQYRIAGVLRRMHAPASYPYGYNELEHFCVPFMRVQNGGTKNTTTQMEDFIRHFRPLTIKDLYTRQKKENVSKIAPLKRARENGILQAVPGLMAHKGPSIMTVNLGNGHRCNPTTNRCTYTGNLADWCNSAGTDQPCSLMSD